MTWYSLTIKYNYYIVLAGEWATWINFVVVLKVSKFILVLQKWFYHIFSGQAATRLIRSLTVSSSVYNSLNYQLRNAFCRESGCICHSDSQRSANTSNLNFHAQNELYAGRKNVFFGYLLTIHGWMCSEFDMKYLLQRKWSGNCSDVVEKC